MKHMSTCNMKLYLVLVASIFFATTSSEADGITFSVHRIESTRSKLIRTGKRSAYQDLKYAIQSSQAASNSQSLIDYEDGEYIANVSIGTPPQSFLVLLDLNTAAFWVPDKRCASTKCPSFCMDAVYCEALCDPRCCSTKSAGLSAPDELDTMEDCGWRNRFDSAKSSSYKQDGMLSTDSLSSGANADGFIGVDTITVSLFDFHLNLRR
ncbi:aspartic protease 2B [Aphelenchoides avenae]|nr:aspartic protease 2B [Aphelenchus avenae]